MSRAVWLLFSKHPQSRHAVEGVSLGERPPQQMEPEHEWSRRGGSHCPTGHSGPLAVCSSRNQILALLEATCTKGWATHSKGNWSQGCRAIDDTIRSGFCMGDQLIPGPSGPKILASLVWAGQVLRGPFREWAQVNTDTHSHAHTHSHNILLRREPGVEQMRAVWVQSLSCLWGHFPQNTTRSKDNWATQHPLKKKNNRSIIALQCCARFCWRAQGTSHGHPHVPSFWRPPSPHDPTPPSRSSQGPCATRQPPTSSPLHAWRCVSSGVRLTRPCRCLLRASRG